MLSDLHVKELDMRFSGILNIIQEFDALQLEIECNSETVEKEYEEREKFEAEYYQLLAAARTILDKYIDKDGDHRRRGSSGSASGFGDAKSDATTSRKWEEYRNNLSKSPTLEEFCKFLRNRADLLESIEESNPAAKSQRFDFSKSRSFHTAASDVERTSHPTKCPMLPCPQISETVNINLLQRHKRVEAIKQHFWHRFTNEYLSTLQQKTKWRTCKDDLTLNSLVIVKDKTSPPMFWLLGRVTKVYPGIDGINRVAEIKTKKGTIRRGWNNLCALPLDEL
ncbi:hypothetical protein NE865_03257 [Phthorimaea operculella]|nr:hypothetical protein NE865_03257 [Phthorimaea operculella]